MLQIRKKEKNSESISVRYLAYDALLLYEMESLPVNPVDALMPLDQVQLRPLEYCLNLIDFVPGYLTQELEKGFVFYSKEDGKYYIIYNSNSPKDEIRWFITTAIAAIRIDHVRYYMGEDAYIDGLLKDSEAQEFAFHFLAPDPVLNACSFTTAASIIKYCKIPFEKAFRKEKYLKRAEKRKYVIKYAVEDLIIQRFKKYIDLHSTN